MIKIADLFCGAGGSSHGVANAFDRLGLSYELTAINHWDLAVATHTRNHPKARHLCESLDNINPRTLYKENELDVLWASPECTHHSMAAGGRPINEQSRATAWCVTRWAEALRPKVIFVENVPEFRDWGPIGSKGRPLKSRKGEIFQSWLHTIESCGYKVDHRILCAADFGAPTTRKRLFVQAVRGQRKITWPEPSHSSEGACGLFGKAKWRPARDIIDWELEGTSIFNRKRPLAPKTMARIMKGLERYGLRSFLVGQQSGAAARPVSQPAPTVAAAGAISLIEPYIVAWDQQGSSKAEWPITVPLSTVTTKARHGVVEPYLVHLKGTGTPLSLDKPTPTIVAGGNHLALADPFLVRVCGPDHRTRDVETPMPTVTGSREWGIVSEPYVVKYYGTGQSRPVSEPLDSVTTKDRFGLVEPKIEINGEQYAIDIRFRMLQPHELAGAQGFPTDYVFNGSKRDAVKQIGNAVVPHIAEALALAAWK